MSNIKTGYKNILEIMAEYKPAYPESQKWHDTISELVQDAIEHEKIIQLQNQLKKHGCFREPVSLYTNSETYEKMVSDGTHRLIAAYLNKETDIHVQYVDDDTTYEYGDNEYSYVVTLKINNDYNSFDEDKICDIFSSTSSIMINDNIWLVSDIGVQEKENIKIYLNDYHKELDTSIILKILEEKLIKHVPEIKILNMNIEIEPWELDD